MKLPFPGLAALVVLTLACGPSPLLTDIQKEVTHLAEPVAMPSIVPAGGAYRYSTPAVTITTSTPGSRLFYTLNGSRPVYNSQGKPDWSNTQSTDQASLGWPSLGAGMGMYPVQAVAWRDGVASKDARAVFRVVGDGGVRWAQTGLGAPEGQVLALNRAQNGNNYSAGWVRKDGVTKMGFVSRYGDDGTPIWFVPIGATLPGSSVTVTGVSSDSIGDVFITGNLVPAGADTFKFGGANTIVASMPSGFLARYDGSGVCQWAVGIKSTVPVFCTGVAVASGNAFVCGWAEGTSNLSVPFQVEDKGVPFSPPNLPSKAGSSGLFSNAFLVKYSIAGNPTGVFSSGVAPGVDRFYAVATNGSSVAVAGAIRGTSPSGGIFDYSGDSTPSADADQWNAVVITMTTAFATIRPRAITGGTVGDSQFNAVALTSGNVVAGGFQNGVLSRSWGSGKSWTGFSSGQNAVVVAYDSTGTTLWVAGAHPGVGAPSSVNALAFNTSGTFVFVGGRLGSNNYSWDTFPITYALPTSAPTGRSPLRAKIDPTSGSGVWFLSSFPGSGDAETLAVAPGPTIPEGGTVYFGGTQPGQQGVDWGQGMRVGAPGPGDNPLVFQTFD